MASHRLYLWKSQSHEVPECNVRLIDGSVLNSRAVLRAFESMSVPSADSSAPADLSAAADADAATVRSEDEQAGVSANCGGDSSCDAISITNADLFTATVQCAVEALQSRRSWKYLHVSRCGGQSDDLVAACMTACTVGSRTSIEHVSVSLPATDILIHQVCFGLKYAAPISLKALTVSTDLSAESANAFARALSQNSTVTDLSLAGSRIQDDAVAPLAFGIRLNSTVRAITLDQCKLGDQKLSQLLIAMQYHRSIRVLSLRHNYCQHETMAAVAALLHFDQLHELDLSYMERPERPRQAQTGVAPKQTATAQSENASDESSVGDSDDGSTADDHQDDPTDTEPSCNENNDRQTPNEAKSNNDDDEEDKGGVQNKSLRVLQMAGNNLSDAYIMSLLQVFGEDNCLEELNLFGNRISDMGLYRMLNRLPALTNLRVLWLGQNPFSTAAAEHLVRYVESNYRLEEVSILTMSTDERRMELQEKINHYMAMNMGGRRIYTESRSTGVPRSLWPHILDRVNRVPSWVSDEHTATFTIDMIFTLLHDPALFQPAAASPR